jgi:[NiFe] hydrogenase assembly HybE family chaperone
VQAARPHPTQAVPVHKVITDKPIIKVPGCPAIAEVMTGVITYILTFDRIPELDRQGRPKMFYSQRIHDKCYRRPHVDAGQFVEAFKRIARTRMADLPLNNPRLLVAVVDFQADDDSDFAPGALITPWSMNLLSLPLRDGLAVLGVGITATRDIGMRRFDFIGTHEPDVGPFEACSLFSPMFEFADQAAAVATAQEALKELRGATAVRPPQQPARRGFLFGRSGTAA